MPTPNSRLADRTAFLYVLHKTGLLTPAQQVKASAALPPEAATARQVAQFLVADGFLTRFQADRLLAGRTDGFVLGQYVIQEQVGRGAVGRVYRANHRTMNRSVAIKVLNPELTRTADAREAFEREVRAAARLNHPNVVTAYDLNEVGGRPYLVLEFVDGPTLDALVRERGPLPVGHACEFVRQVAWGLQHAHEQGLVHRDVKPANLLVARPSKSSPACLVKIADFGIARTAPAEPGGSRGLVGTPDYVAPEQADDPNRADHRSDLYSLGCVFYFLLTGKPPFPGGTPQDKVRRHRSEEPVRVERLRPDVLPAVAGIVHKLLAKDPAARFASAAELAERLEGLATGFGGPAVDGGSVGVELPPPEPGTHSFTGGSLTGTGETPADGSETSPWGQLTDEVATPAARRAARAKEPRAAGLWWTILVGCALAIGFVIRTLAQ